MERDSSTAIKDEVRAFYDSVGWKQVGGGLYQNARYEDLRPVCREYISRCHRRVSRHLPAQGRYLLDAGSGPIQYPEYLEYSRGYGRRVCLDLSRLALVEARDRIADHGFFVQGDISALPFPAGVFDGVVSLHALHHVPAPEQEKTLRELARVTAFAGTAVVVYSWGRNSGLMRALRPLLALVVWVRRRLRPAAPPVDAGPAEVSRAKGSHTFKHDQKWMDSVLARLRCSEIRVWRSVGTEITRNLVHARLGGKWILRAIFALEEAFPRWFGRHGVYPMILLGALEGAQGRGGPQ